jgi:hypothetical protein
MKLVVAFISGVIALATVACSGGDLTSEQRVSEESVGSETAALMDSLGSDSQSRAAQLTGCASEHATCMKKCFKIRNQDLETACEEDCDKRYCPQ